MTDLKSAIAKDTWSPNVFVFGACRRNETAKFGFENSLYTYWLNSGLSSDENGTAASNLYNAHQYANRNTPVTQHTTSSPNAQGRAKELPRCSKFYNYCHGLIIEGAPKMVAYTDEDGDTYRKHDAGEAALLDGDTDLAYHGILPKMGVPKSKKTFMRTPSKQRLESYLKDLDQKYTNSPDRKKQEVYLYFTGHGNVSLSDSGRLKAQQFLVKNKGVSPKQAKAMVDDFCETYWNSDKEKPQTKAFFDVCEKMGLKDDKDFDGRFWITDDDYLTESELKTWVKKYCHGFGKVVIILDTCHAGASVAKNDASPLSQYPNLELPA